MGIDSEIGQFLARIAPSPMLLALWATLLVSYASYELVVRGELLRARASRDLELVLRSGEDLDIRPPESPAWARAPGQLVTAVGLSFAGLLLFGAGLGTLALAVAGALLPRLLWRWMRRRQAAKIDEDMPDLLAALAASARMSGDLPTLLMDAARDLAAKGEDRPLAQLVAQAAARVRAGGADAGLSWLAAQTDNSALQALCQRLRLFAALGGGFAAQLEESARRQRRRMEGIYRAMSKASGATALATLLLAMTVVGTVVIALGDPQARAFYGSAGGQIAVGVIYGWMLFGYTVVQQMADVR